MSTKASPGEQMLQMLMEVLPAGKQRKVSDDDDLVARHKLSATYLDR